MSQDPCGWPRDTTWPIDKLIRRLERMIDMAREAQGKKPKYNKKHPKRSGAK